MLSHPPCVIGFPSVQLEAVRTGSHPSGGWLVSAVYPCRTGTSRSCSPSEVCTPITSRCGVGSSGMPQKWNDVCALGSDRPTTVGVWTKPISESRASGARDGTLNQEIIILCVRWYITFKLSFRDLVQMMAERGITLTHTTILRWVQRYVPEFEKRWSQYARPVGDSWRVDETYLKIKGQWVYLYRAVD
jgi:hypothetical protein